ncbi:MAG TPA: ATP-binding protein [Pyrinomonadaceae bacterium]|jgi:two-component system phosphate regulon sensor histidine kinase PhoR
MALLTSWFSKKGAVEKTSRPILTKILETMRESVLVVGEDTRILASNKAAYNDFGRKNGALENKRLSEVIRDLNLHEAFRKALEDAEFSDLKLEIPGSAEKRRYDVHIAPIELDGAKSAVGVFYDITQIEHLERVRQEFFSNISHELRTPLTSILAFVETLEDGAIEDEENNRRFLSVIRRNAERMHRLIDDILELSSIESGNIELAVKPTPLAGLVREVFTNLSNKAVEREINLINEVADETRVCADAVRLEQMLTNLIDNAVKFNRERGSVTVSCVPGDAKDLISVADTGEGISSEHLLRIFERFYRTDRARSREIGGTGLGLAIVKHLARLHGGEISVVSNLGKGTVFSVELPKNK